MDKKLKQALLSLFFLLIFLFALYLYWLGPHGH